MSECEKSNSFSKIEGKKKKSQEILQRYVLFIALIKIYAEK